MLNSVSESLISPLVYSAPPEPLGLFNPEKPQSFEVAPRATLTCHRGLKLWNIFSCSENTTLTSKVGRFIRQQYFLAHGARLSQLMKNLYALQEEDGTLLGAVGLDSFSDEPRLVECYLKQPAEAYLSDHLGETVRRDQIMEAGNLAATNLTGAILLTAFLTNEADRQQKSWALFTATAAVRAALKRIGIPYQSLLKATLDCVGNQYGDWGSYYQQDPEVVLVNVGESMGAVGRKYDIARLC